MFPYIERSYDLIDLKMKKEIVGLLSTQMWQFNTYNNVQGCTGLGLWKIRRDVLNFVLPLHDSYFDVICERLHNRKQSVYPDLNWLNQLYDKFKFGQLNQNW